MCQKAAANGQIVGICSHHVHMCIYIYMGILYIKRVDSRLAGRADGGAGLFTDNLMASEKYDTTVHEEEPSTGFGCSTVSGDEWMQPSVKLHDQRCGECGFCCNALN